MSSTENQEIINEALNSTEFTERINEGAATQVSINQDFKPRMKDILDEFVGFEIRSNPEILKIAKKKSKDRTDEEKTKYSTFTKQSRKKFNTIMRFAFPKNPTADPLTAMIDKIVSIAKMLKYIDAGDVGKKFTDMGLELNVPLLEEENEQYAKEGSKEILKEIFSQANEVQTQITEKTDYINIDIFNKIETNIRYDPDCNPQGITVPQFKKLVRTKTIAIEKSPEKYTEYKKKLIDNAEAALVSDQIVLEKQREL